MKASRIIIISFCIFIVGGMLIMYIDARQHKKQTDNSISKKEYVLPSFNVVVAEQGIDGRQPGLRDAFFRRGIRTGLQQQRDAQDGQEDVLSHRYCD